MNMGESKSLHEAARTPESLPLQSIGIIGHGHFGKLVEELAGRFAPGVTVRIFSPEAEVDKEKFFPIEQVASSNAVVLAVPIREYEKVLKQIVPSLRPESTIIDIATVKEYSANLVREIAPNQRFISMHPMFGPQSYRKREGNVEGFRVVITDTNLPPNEISVFRKFLRASGAEVIQMTSEKHDLDLANTLFITHLVGQTLARAGVQRTAIDTPSFGWLMDAVESVKDDSALFGDVFKYNRFCEQALYRFGLAEEEVHDLFLRPKN